MSSDAEDAKKRIRLGIKVTVIVLVVGGLIFAVDKGFDIGIYSAIGAGIGSISSGGGGGGGVSGGAGGGGAGGGGGMGIILIAAVAIILFMFMKGRGSGRRGRPARSEPPEEIPEPLSGDNNIPVDPVLNGEPAGNGSLYSFKMHIYNNTENEVVVSGVTITGESVRGGTHTISLSNKNVPGGHLLSIITPGRSSKPPRVPAGGRLEVTAEGGRNFVMGTIPDKAKNDEDTVREFFTEANWVVYTPANPGP